MSTAIKNNPLLEDEIWIGDRQAIISKGLAMAGSPWGHGFGFGLAVAFIIILPLFFAYVLIGGSIKERAALTSSAPRDFSMTTDPMYKDYLEK